MVFGIRVSYSETQIVSAKTYPGPPVCPCGSCYDAAEHERIRSACRNPARELRMPSGNTHVPNPFSRLSGSGSGSGSGKHRFGVRLGRRQSGQSVASVASGRPLRTAAQIVPRVSGEVRSGVDGVDGVDGKM